jgi:hypothetical protein
MIDFEPAVIYIHGGKVFPQKLLCTDVIRVEYVFANAVTDIHFTLLVSQRFEYVITRKQYPVALHIDDIGRINPYSFFYRIRNLFKRELLERMPRGLHKQE